MPKHLDGANTSHIAGNYITISASVHTIGQGICERGICMYTGVLDLKQAQEWVVTTKLGASDKRPGTQVGPVILPCLPCYILIPAPQASQHSFAYCPISIAGQPFSV